MFGITSLLAQSIILHHLAINREELLQQSKNHFTFLLKKLKFSASFKVHLAIQ